MSGLGTPLMAGSGPSSQSAAGDPFYVFRDGLSTEVEKVRLSFDQWKDMLNNTNTATNPQFPAAHAALKKSLTRLNTDLVRLEHTVVVVEKAPHKFGHVTAGELAQRRGFVDSTRATIKAMEAEYKSKRTAGKMQNDKRKELTSRPKGAAGGDDRNPYGASHDKFIGDQRQRQDQIRRTQDEHLDGLGESVERLGAMASTINVELAEQDRMLEDLDRDVDEAQGNMDAALKQIQKLLQTKDKCQLWSIFLLTLTFIILTVIVFTT